MRPRGPPMATRGFASATGTLLRTPWSARTAPARLSAPSVTRTFLRPPENNASVLDSLDVHRIARDRYNYERRRRIFLYCGAISGLVATCYTAWKIKVLLDNPIRADAAGTAASSIDQARKVVVHDKDGREIVPTGNSTVPEFPRTLVLGDLDGKKKKDAAPVSSHTIVIPNGAVEDEYTLVGLGTRTVSFLSIQVYVVGFYIATADIAALQNRLVKRVNPIATALVPSEKDDLRASLLDPAEGEALWDALLADGVPARSLFRIVPVRDTDFPHLRDGFVRAIQAKAPRILEQTANADGVSEQEAAEGASATPDFGESVKEFRRAFNRGKAPKKQELLMVRDADGSLRVVFDDGRSSGRQVLGSVSDERLSRALWLNYLGGRKVASAETQKSIVDGVIEFVERPIGTVAAQVV